MVIAGYVKKGCSAGSLSSSDITRSLTRSHTVTTMPPDLFSTSPSNSHAALHTRRLRSFLRFKKALKIGFFSIPFLLTGLIIYATFFPLQTPSGNLPDSHHPSPLDLDSVPDDPPSPLQSSPVSDVLTLQQIRDIVAPTRGFFSRDYSLYLGWDNVSVSLGIRCQIQMLF